MPTAASRHGGETRRPDGRRRQGETSRLSPPTADLLRAGRRFCPGFPGAAGLPARRARPPPALRARGPRPAVTSPCLGSPQIVRFQDTDTPGPLHAPRCRGRRVASRPPGAKRLPAGRGLGPPVTCPHSFRTNDAWGHNISGTTCQPHKQVRTRRYLFSIRRPINPPLVFRRGAARDSSPTGP